MDHSIPHSHREPIKTIINNNNTKWFIEYEKYQKKILKIQ